MSLRGGESGAADGYALSMGLDNPVHIAFLLVVLLLVFGAKRLPEMGRSLGGGLREFKDSISGSSSHDEEPDRQIPPPAASAPPPAAPAAPPPAAATPAPPTSEVPAPARQPAGGHEPAQG